MLVLLSAFDSAPWHELYVMTGGAAGALTGLLFVAVSINLNEILSFAWLPRRAAETLVIMVGLLVLSLLVLIPQSTVALGWETLAQGLVVLVVAIARRWRHHPGNQSPKRRVFPPLLVRAGPHPRLHWRCCQCLGSTR
jgi:peptidoglycan/LPS O-acetylase OafA/YrhL